MKWHDLNDAIASIVVIAIGLTIAWAFIALHPETATITWPQSIERR